MPISIEDFWKVCVAGGLLTRTTCQQLQTQFDRQRNDGQSADARQLAEWLIAGGTLSRYQATVISSGRPGPFVFGDFVIVERIEAGRLARTFRATYKNKQPALLVFDTAAGDSPQQTRETIERFELARAVKHPQVLRVFQFQATAAPPFFVIENLQGQSLRERAAGGTLSWQDTCRIGCQAALGLAAIHEQRGVHGNLSPDNVWVEPPGAGKLLQFPLAPPLVGNQRLTAGNIGYLAPELAEPSREADALSDIYALGCTLYEIIAGQLPLMGATARETLARRACEAPPRLDQLVPGVSEPLAALVSEMLEAEPLARAQNAAYVVQRLQAIVAGEPIPAATRPPAPAASTTPATPAQTAAAGTGQAGSSERSATARRQGAARTGPTGAPIIVIDPQDVQTVSALGEGGLAPRRRSLSTTVLAFLAGLAIVVLGALAGLYALTRSGAIDPRATATDVGPNASSTNAPVQQFATPDTENQSGDQVHEEQSVGSAAAGTRGSSSDAAPPGIVKIDDDGQTLWASPTDGAPLDLRYAPSSAQVLVALRPSEILASDEGARFVSALGPAGEAITKQLRTTLGVELTDVEQLLIAFAPDDAGAPQAVYTMRLVGPIAETALVAAWGNPRAVSGTAPFYQGARLAYFVPAEGAGRVAVIGPPALVKEIAERGGPPLLRKGLEALVGTSDEQRHLTLLAAPSYLLTDGDSLLVGDLSKLHGPLAAFFDMSVQAVLASAHFGEELFLELRAVGPVDTRPEELADRLRARLDSAGDELEQYVAMLAPQTYGRLVVNRFPRMVQLAGTFARSAGEDRQAVLRCYLPAIAAHNLALGAELTLAEAPGLAPSTQAPPPVAAPGGAAEALARVVSLSFPRDTLERSMELLSAEIDTPIVILGPDLQLEGITKNQSFGLDERDRPAREILLKVLALANPDGKLVYTVQPGEAGRETIFITTRAAAGRRGDRLPDELLDKSPPKKP